MSFLKSYPSTVLVCVFLHTGSLTSLVLADSARLLSHNLLGPTCPLPLFSARGTTPAAFVDSGDQFLIFLFSRQVHYLLSYLSCLHLGFLLPLTQTMFSVSVPPFSVCSKWNPMFLATLQKELLNGRKDQGEQRELLIFTILILSIHALRLSGVFDLFTLCYLQMCSAKFTAILGHMRLDTVARVNLTCLKQLKRPSC